MNLDHPNHENPVRRDLINFIKSRRMVLYYFRRICSLHINDLETHKGIGYHLQDHLQYEYMAKCKKPVTANNLIWNLFISSWSN